MHPEPFSKQGTGLFIFSAEYARKDHHQERRKDHRGKVRCWKASLYKDPEGLRTQVPPQQANLPGAL